MDEFLLIVTPEWTEVPDFINVIQNAALDQIQGSINEADWATMSAYAVAWGLITEEQQVTNARLFLTGEVDNPARFWMMTAPA